MCLKNESKVSAKWSLNYVKIPAKGTLGYRTITRLERENIDKTDDQSVFAFSLAEVLLGPDTFVGVDSRAQSRHHLDASGRVHPPLREGRV